MGLKFFLVFKLNINFFFKFLKLNKGSPVIKDLLLQEYLTRALGGFCPVVLPRDGLSPLWEISSDRTGRYTLCGELVPSVSMPGTPRLPRPTLQAPAGGAGMWRPLLI